MSRPRSELVRALVLDLDGVVTDTAEHHLAAWTELARTEGIALAPGLREALRGRSREDSLRLVLGERERTSAEVEALLAAKNAAYLTAIAALGPGDVLPGAREAIDTARRRGLAVAIGSSSRNAARILERLGATDWFDVVVDGTMVDRAKPAPDVFLLAAERLGVDPAACLVVEDAEAGVAAAHAAGMRCVGVGPVARVGGADVRVDSMADLDLDRVLDALEGASGPA